MKMRTLTILTTALLWTLPAAGAEVVTACDLLAGHPLDPDRLVPGIPTATVMQDLDTATAVCRRDLANDPQNRRLEYNLGRVLFYARDYETGFAHIARAAAAGHRQAQFVEGLIRRRGQEGAAPADLCATLPLWLDAALRGHFGATMGVARGHLAGDFDDCSPPPNSQELLSLVEKAAPDATDFFQRLLVDQLIQDLQP